MKTQIEYAMSGIITPEIYKLASQEGRSPQELMNQVARGSVIVMVREDRVVGIGSGLRTKVNVNIGTSGAKAIPSDEILKAGIAEQYGADTLSELSMGGPVREIRSQIRESTSLPLTTVPIYESAARGGIEAMDEELIITTIEDQVCEGISSVVLHTISQEQIQLIRKTERIMGVVSKGGSIVASHMHLAGIENPHLTHFSDILEILHEHDVVLSLGNALRGGCIHDPRDIPQERELKDNIRLARQARDAGVQTIIEWSGGHVRADRITENIQYYKNLSEFPLFVAGPLPVDTAVGHDHIAGCVGASIASGAGADYLCYITPSEHLGLPSPNQVKEGLIAFKIAAHIGDTMKFGPGERDRDLARCRRAMDFEGQFSHAIDGNGARLIRTDEGICTMCGDFCAIRLMEQIIR